MVPQYIIIIGGGRGSLEPLKTIFSHTELDNASYVILRNLPPKYESTLDIILRRRCKLNVVRARKKGLIKKNTIYFAPTDKYIVRRGGKIDLVDRDSTSKNAMDVFLDSMIENENKEKVVLVFLSGNMKDGLLHIAPIKKAGGLIIAQAPESCKFPAMPKNLIDTGLVDYILKPEDIPLILKNYTSRSKELKDSQ